MTGAIPNELSDRGARLKRADGSGGRVAASCTGGLQHPRRSTPGQADEHCLSLMIPHIVVGGEDT